jgi:hypothetical protein
LFKGSFYFIKTKPVSLCNSKYMDIALKYMIVEKIIQSEDDALLSEVGAILGVPQIDFWHELPNEVKQSINEAKAELDRGEGIPHEQVMAEIKERFLKS